MSFPPLKRPFPLSVAQEWTTATALARYLGVATKTVHRWIASGQLRGAQVAARHYADDRPRKTSRAQWRIHRDDLVTFLERVRAGTKPPASLFKG